MPDFPTRCTLKSQHFQNIVSYFQNLLLCIFNKTVFFFFKSQLVFYEGRFLFGCSIMIIHPSVRLSIFELHYFQTSAVLDFSGHSIFKFTLAPLSSLPFSPMPSMRPLVGHQTNLQTYDPPTVRAINRYIHSGYSPLLSTENLVVLLNC